VSDTPKLDIAPVPSFEQEVNEDTIQILEEYLEAARSGDITEVVVVGIGGGIIRTSCSMTTSLITQLGALAIAKENVIRSSSE